MGEKSIDKYILQDTNRKNGVYDDNNDIISKNSPTQKSKENIRQPIQGKTGVTVWYQDGDG